MAAEPNSDDGAGTHDGAGNAKVKKWDITTHKGFTAWALSIGAYVAANTSVRQFHGIDSIDDATIASAHRVPWAGYSHEEIRTAIDEYKAKHHESLGKFYSHLLYTIDYTKDKAFERYLLAEIAPDLVAGTPPAPWKLLAYLQERGDIGGVLAQDRIETDVDDFEVPFSESPESITRALLTYVGDWQSLDINQGAPPRRIYKCVFELLKKGGQAWREAFAYIELQFASSPSTFRNVEESIKLWETTIFRHCTKLSHTQGEVHAAVPHGGRPPRSGSSSSRSSLVKTISNDCNTCDLNMCTAKDNSRACHALNALAPPPAASKPMIAMAAFVRWYCKRTALKTAKNIELPKYDKNSQLAIDWKAHKESMKRAKVSPIDECDWPIFSDDEDEAGDDVAPVGDATPADVHSSVQQWVDMSQAEQNDAFTDLLYQHQQHIAVIDTPPKPYEMAVLMLNPHEDDEPCPKLPAEPSQPRRQQAPPQPSQGLVSSEQPGAAPMLALQQSCNTIVAGAQPSSAIDMGLPQSRAAHQPAACMQLDNLRSQQGQPYDELCDSTTRAACEWRDSPDYRPLQPPRHQQQQRSRPIHIGPAELRAAADEQRRINQSNASLSNLLSSADPDPHNHAIPSYPNAHQLPPAAHQETQPQHPLFGKGRGLGRGRLIAGRHPQREQPASPHQLAAGGRGRDQLLPPKAPSVTLPLLSQLVAASPSPSITTPRGSSSYAASQPSSSTQPRHAFESGRSMPPAGSPATYEPYDPNNAPWQSLHATLDGHSPALFVQHEGDLVECNKCGISTPPNVNCRACGYLAVGRPIRSETRRTENDRLVEGQREHELQAGMPPTLRQEPGGTYVSHPLPLASVAPAPQALLNGVNDYFTAVAQQIADSHKPPSPKHAAPDPTQAQQPAACTQSAAGDAAATEPAPHAEVALPPPVASTLESKTATLVAAPPGFMPQAASGAQPSFQLHKGLDGAPLAASTSPEATASPRKKTRALEPISLLERLEDAKLTAFAEPILALGFVDVYPFAEMDADDLVQELANQGHPMSFAQKKSLERMIRVITAEAEEIAIHARSLANSQQMLPPTSSPAAATQDPTRCVLTFTQQVPAQLLNQPGGSSQQAQAQQAPLQAEVQAPAQTAAQQPAQAPGSQPAQHAQEAALAASSHPSTQAGQAGPSASQLLAQTLWSSEASASAAAASSEPSAAPPNRPPLSPDAAGIQAAVDKAKCAQSVCVADSDLTVSGVDEEGWTVAGVKPGKKPARAPSLRQSKKQNEKAQILFCLPLACHADKIVSPAKIAPVSQGIGEAVLDDCSDVALITSGGAASANPEFEMLADTGGGKCYLMRTLHGADLASRGPAVFKSIGGFVGGGAAKCECSYEYHLDAIVGGQRIQLPPTRYDYCPEGRVNVFPETAFCKQHKINLLTNGEEGTRILELKSGQMIELTIDSRDLSWIAFKPSIRKPAAHALAISSLEHSVTSIKPHALALRELSLMVKVGDVTESASCRPWHVKLVGDDVPIVLTGALARKRAASQPAAVILPGNAPSSRGRQHPSHAKGSKLGVSNGKPAVSYKPVELLTLWHSMLNHARIDLILDYAQYHYPHLRKLITKEVIEEYAKAPCPACSRYLVKSTHVPMTGLAPSYETETMVVDAFGPVSTPSAEFGFTFAIGCVYQDGLRAFIHGTCSLTSTNHAAAARATVVQNAGRHPAPRIIITDALRATTASQSFEWRRFADEDALETRNSHAGGHYVIGDVEKIWRLWRVVKAMLANAMMAAKHWYSALKHAVLVSQLTNNRKDDEGQPISDFCRHEGYDFPVEVLEPYGCPCWYVRDPAHIGSKFKDHAFPARYVGVAPNAPLDYAWLFTVQGQERHISMPLGLCRFDRTWAAAKPPSLTISDAISNLTAKASVVRPVSAPIPRHAPAGALPHGPLGLQTPAPSAPQAPAATHAPPAQPLPVRASVVARPAAATQPGAQPTQQPRAAPAPQAPRAPPVLAQPVRPQATSIVTIDMGDWHMPTEPYSRADIDATLDACKALHVSCCEPHELINALDTGHDRISAGAMADIIRRSDFVGIMQSDVRFIASTSTNAAEVASLAARFEMAALQAAPDIPALSKDVLNAVHKSPDIESDVCLSEIDSQGRVLAICVDVDTGKTITHDYAYIFDAGKDTCADVERDMYIEVMPIADGQFITVTKDGKTEELHEPKGYGGYLRSPIKSRWRSSMVIEVENIIGHSTVQEVRCDHVKAKGKKIYGIVWIFKVKRHADGSLDKLKSRACVVGSAMEKGVDF